MQGHKFQYSFWFTSGGLNSSIPPSIFCLSALFTCLAFWTLVKNNKVNQLHKESWSLYTFIFTRIATSVPPKLEREILWFKASLLLTVLKKTLKKQNKAHHSLLWRKKIKPVFQKNSLSARILKAVHNKLFLIRMNRFLKN